MLGIYYLGKWESDFLFEPLNNNYPVPYNQ